MLLDISKKKINFERIFKSFKKNLIDYRKFGLKFLFFKFILKYSDLYRIRGNFLSLKETWDLVINTNKSIIRLGDGEMLLLRGKSIIYQNYSYRLEQGLKKIIKNYDKNSPYLLCLPVDFIQASNKKLKESDRDRIWLNSKIFYMTFFPKKVSYGNALIFRLMNYFSINLKDIYENKNIIFVANEES